MKVKLWLALIRKNLLISFKTPVLVSFILIILTVILFPTAALKGNDVCKPIESMLSFVGVIVMTPVFLPEQDKCIYDSVASKKMSISKIYFLRFILSVLLILILVFGFCMFLTVNECHVTTYMIFGGAASAFFLGSIGFMFAGFTGNVINGIFASTIYYLSNYGLKKRLGFFYLFRMSSGEYTGKIWLIIAGTLFVILTFIKLSPCKFPRLCDTIKEAT